MACGILALSSPAAAAPGDPPTLPGGLLDTRFPGIDVYLEAPAPAKPPAGPACAAAQAYVDRINAGRFGDVADLFAPDGEVYYGPGHLHRGLARISAFYEGIVAPMQPDILAVGFVGSGDNCAVELASHTDLEGQRRFVLSAIDLFTVGRDGKVLRMIAFGRRREVPPSPPQP